MVCIRVEYDPSRCCGAGLCAKKDPTLFKMDGKVAKLLSSKVEGSLQCLEQDYTAAQVHTIMAAAHHCPTNAIRVADMDNNVELVGVHVHADGCKDIEGEYQEERDFVLDAKGYFLIRIDREKKLLEVGFCANKNKVEVKISGKKPRDIYHAVAQLQLVSRPEHYAYLGKELQKAYTALRLKKKYVQDDELEH